MIKSVLLGSEGGSELVAVGWSCVVSMAAEARLDGRSGCDGDARFSVVLTVGCIDEGGCDRPDVLGFAIVVCRWSRVLISRGVELCEGITVAWASAWVIFCGSVTELLSGGLLTEGDGRSGEPIVQSCTLTSPRLANFWHRMP